VVGEVEGPGRMQATTRLAVGFGGFGYACGGII
jgi:hypothetical protein